MEIPFKPPETVEIEASWVQEALRREAAVAQGKSYLVPGEAALALIRAKVTAAKEMGLR